MKILSPRSLLIGLFALATVGPASALQMKTTEHTLTAPAPAQHVAAQENPWPSLASVADTRPAAVLAHDDDRYWRDGRWHSHRDDWRREQWRREQHRREIEHRRAMERKHERAMHQRWEAEHRHYRR